MSRSSFVLVTLLATLAGSNLLTACGAGPLYTGTTVSTPTLAGNGEISTTNVAGLYQRTNVRNPDGREMVTSCLAIQRAWNEYLRSTGMLAATANTWMSWVRMQQLSSAADRCIDYATFGSPMSNGGYGYGYSNIGGNSGGLRPWTYKE